MAQFEVILIGTGTPLPSNDRCGGSNVVLGSEAVLIDCGWGASRKLMTSGVTLDRINHLFFTHLHSDHITDLPDFLMMRWTAFGSKQPLHIYGPEGTREVVAGFRSGLNPDVRYRIDHHGDKLDPRAMDCIVHEIPATPDATFVATVGDLTVSAFEVDHEPVKPALGFRVERAGASVVFSGDTKRCDTLVRAAKGTDVLVSEALHIGMMNARVTLLRGAGQERLAELLVDAMNYHAPTLDVAEMAREAGVGKLVLTHLIPPIPNEGPLTAQFIEGMSEIYHGPIELGRDLHRITVTP